MILLSFFDHLKANCDGNKKSIRKLTFFLLAFYCLTIYNHSIAQVQHNQKPDQEQLRNTIDREVKFILDKYFYSNYDSSLYLFRKLAHISKKNQLWPTYLKVITNIQGLSNAHYELDSLYHYINIADQFIENHTSDINSSPELRDRVTKLAYSKGIYHYRLGDYVKGLEVFNNLSELVKTSPKIDSFFNFLLSDYMGLCHLNLKNYSLAKTYYENARTWLPKQREYHPPRDYNYFQAIIESHLGEVHYLKGLVSRSHKDYMISYKYFRKALDIVEKKQYNIKLKNALLSYYRSMALVQKQLNDYDSSLYYSQKSLALHLENDPNLFNTYAQIADVYLGKKDYNRAIESYHKSLAITQQKFKQKHFQKGELLSKLGQVYAEKGNHQQALNYFQQALVQFVDNFQDSKNIYQNPTITSDQFIVEAPFLEVLNHKAKALFALYQSQKTNIKVLKSSLNTYELAIKVSNRLSKGFMNLESKQLLAMQLQDLYNGAVQTAYQTYQDGLSDLQPLNKLFAFIEHSKGALLIEHIQESQAKSFAQIPLEVLENERKLKQKLYYFKQQLRILQARENHNTNEVENLKNKLFGIEKEYDNFIVQLEKNYKSYYELKYDKETISLNQLKNQLNKEKTLLIEYFYGKDAIFVFGVQGNMVVVKKVAITPKLENKLTNFIQKNSPQYYFNANYVRQKGDDFHQAFLDDAHYLYKELIHPIFEALPNNNLKKLSIIPDGLLAYLPFDILNTQTSPEVHFTKPAYLIKHYAINYGYSSTLLFKFQNIKSDIKDRLTYAGFAPSYQAKGIQINLNKTDKSRAFFSLEKLTPLKYNLQEVKYGHEIFGGQVFLNNDASRENFFIACAKC